LSHTEKNTHNLRFVDINIQIGIALPTPDELEVESINMDALKTMARKFPKTVLKGVTQSGLGFDF